MKNIKILICVLVAFVGSNLAMGQTAKYKCMLQMSNYVGEGAYVVVSLMNPKGEYEKTLYIMGDDKKWYNNFKEWYKVFEKRKKVDAKTGASVAGGDRSMTVFELDEKKINTGYKIRFESVVEDQKYHAADVEIPFTTEGIQEKSNGKGYIRYVKLTKI